MEKNIYFKNDPTPLAFNFLSISFVFKLLQLII